MKNQKGFAPILLILLGLVVIGGGVYFYNLSSNKEGSLIVENETNISTTTSEQSKVNNDKSTYNTQEEVIVGRTSTAEYDNYIENRVVPNGWTQKEDKIDNVKILTFIVPNEYKDVISTEIINKEMDSAPENFGLDTVGGSVSNLKEYSIYPGGVRERNIVGYSFVTATNYKWVMYETNIDNSKHLELGYTYKTELENPKIPQDVFDKIIGSVKIEE